MRGGDRDERRRGEVGSVVFDSILTFRFLFHVTERLDIFTGTVMVEMMDGGLGFVGVGWVVDHGLSVAYAFVGE